MVQKAQTEGYVTKAQTEVYVTDSCHPECSAVYFLPDTTAECIEECLG